MQLIISDIGKLFKLTFKEWLNKDPFRQSAVIAYYAIFSIPGLLLLIITITGYFFGKDVVDQNIFNQISSTMGIDIRKARQPAAPRPERKSRSSARAGDGSAPAKDRRASGRARLLLPCAPHGSGLSVDRACPPSRCDQSHRTRRVAGSNAHGGLTAPPCTAGRRRR